MSTQKIKLNNKTEKFYIHIFNIKLYSSTRKGKDAYIELFNELYQKKITKPTGHSNNGILRTQFSTANSDVIYGKISRFTLIDIEGEWLNMEKMEKDSYELPKHLFPNLKETDYYFIPEAHRLAVKRDSSVSLNTVTNFLNNALKEVVRQGEAFEVNIEQSISAFEEIFNAKRVASLEIDISYSNADFNEAATEYMDNELKSSNTQKVKMTFRPDQHNSIQVENSQIISGALGLAKSNGSAVAVIYDDNNKRKTVETKSFPRLERMEAKADEIKSTIFDFITQTFRRGE